MKIEFDTDDVKYPIKKFIRKVTRPFEKQYNRFLLKMFDKIYNKYNQDHSGYITKYTCNEVRQWWLDYKIYKKYQ
jgi:hypothetical protein